MFVGEFSKTFALIILNNEFTIHKVCKSDIYIFKISSFSMCKKIMDILMFQRCIVMRRFYISSIQVRMKYSLPRTYAVFCGRFIITVN